MKWWLFVRYYLEYANVEQVHRWMFQNVGTIDGIPNIPGI